MHTFDRIVGATVNVRDIKPLTVEEVPRLLDAANSPMHRAMYATGIGQGLRPGEIPLLRWEDIDWEQKKVCVLFFSSLVFLLPLLCGLWL